MPTKKKQHYVPQFYLRGFACGRSRRQIGLYHLPSDRYVAVAPLRTQAYENDFYGDVEIEDYLSRLEGRASTIITNIVERELLPERLSKDHHALVTFVLFQRFRTTHAASALEELADKGVKNIISHDPEVKDHLDKFRIRLKNPASLCMSRAAESNHMMWDLRYKVFRNRTSQPFITSDNPVVFYNQFMEHRNPSVSNTGIACKGLQVFLPLDPRHHIVFYDAAVYQVGGRRLDPVFVDLSLEEDVFSLNVLQAVNANEHVYFTESLKPSVVRDIVARCRRFRRPHKVRVREFEAGADESGRRRSFLVAEMAEVRAALKLHPVRILAAAQAYDIGRRLLHVRDPVIAGKHEEFIGLVRAGKYGPDEFPEFLGGKPSRIGSRLR